MFSKLRQYTAFYLLASIFLALTGYSLFSDGMFMDGTIYAAVSKNMANGLGSFWQPHLSQTLFTKFYEHPPLAIGMQALAFQLFGDSFLVERFYSLSTFLISAYLIVQIWIQIGKPKHQAWIPLLFWVANPLVIWAVANNMLENTMQIFILASVWMLLKSTGRRTIVWIILSGFFLFFGLLSKGLVALFPWTFYFWIWLFTKNISWPKMLINTSLLLLFTLLPLLVLIYFNEDALHSLQSYFNQQIVRSLKEIQTVPSRFFIVGRFLNESLLNFGIILLLAFFFRKKLHQFKLSFKENASHFYLFIGLGFSGVLPIMLSLKQSGFYMLPAFPFFALAFGILVYPLLENAKPIFSDKKFLYRNSGILSLFLLLLIFGASLSFKNKIGRDKEMLEDVYAMASVISDGEVLGIPKNLAQNWSLHAYFARYSNISLDDVSKEPHPFYLSNINERPHHIERYEKMELDLKRFSLYQLINP